MGMFRGTNLRRRVPTVVQEFLPFDPGRLAQDMIGAWPMDEFAWGFPGVPRLDASLNGNDNADDGTVGSAGGPNGDAVRLNGVDEYLVSQNTYNALPMSVAIRTRGRYFNLPATAYNLVGNWDGSTSGWSVEFQALGASFKGRYYVDGSNYVETSNQSFSNDSDNYWMLGCVFEEDEAKPFVQRTFTSATSWTGTGGVSTESGPIYIGRTSNGSVYAEHDIGEIIIFNKALNQSDLDELSNSIAPTVGPTFADLSKQLQNAVVHYWACDEFSDGTSSVVRADSVGSNNLTDPTNARSVKLCRYGSMGAYAWSYVRQVDADPSLTIRSQSGMGLTCWVTPLETAPGTTDPGGILMKDQNATNSEWNITYNVAGDVTFRVLGAGGDPNTSTVTIAGALSAFTPAHIAAWVEPDGHADEKKAKLQINGGSVATAAAAFTGDFNAQVRSINFGTTFWPAFDTSRTQISDVNYIGRAPTAQERAYIYNNGDGRKYLGPDPPYWNPV